MSESAYRCTLPENVVSITKPKFGDHNRNWILVAARDQFCDLVVVEIGHNDEVCIRESVLGVAYADLWDNLEWLAVSRKSTWIITFRSRYVLQQSGWIAALESGAIELERQRKLAGKQAGAGRVSLSHGFTEIDFRLAGRKVKLLDWQNFGVSLENYGVPANEQNSELAFVVFRDFISAYSKIGLSANRTSAAQVGWAKLRQSFNRSIAYTSLDPGIRALERRCYYGGRCEPYRLGEINRPVYSIDVRAAYASICAHVFLPVQPLRYYPDGFSLEMQHRDFMTTVAADVVIETTAPDYPVRHEGKVIYPTGRFFTSLCGEEYGHAMRSGRIKKVTRAVTYVSLPILLDYAEWYMDARAALDQAGLQNQVSGFKALFNSSLGFLARQGREWSEWLPAGSSPWWFGVTLDPDDHASIVRAHVLDKKAEWLRIGSEPRNCSPIMHAAICAAARMNLASIMCAAGRANVFYCDTDGIIVSNEGYRLLEIKGTFLGDAYGQLSIRHQAERVSINGQKSYRIGNHVICAGMSKENHLQWQTNGSPICSTGRADIGGKITPFVFNCEDKGDERQRYVNTICEPVPDS